MGFYATDTACARQQKTHPPPENRVVGSADHTASCTRSTWSETQCSRPENDPTPTTTASGVRYYGYRYYSPELGRWLSRDPIAEWGVVHTIAGGRPNRKLRDRMTLRSSEIYQFVGNTPINRIDLLGLVTVNGDCSPFTAAEVKSKIEADFSTLIAAVKEPFKTALQDNWDNMVFECKGNDSTYCKWTEGGDVVHTARGMTPGGAGVLRDVSASGTLPGGGSYSYTISKYWKTSAILCRCQIGSLEQYAKTAFHEAAHCVGWGGAYKDDTDATYDNLPPSVQMHPHQTYWGIP